MSVTKNVVVYPITWSGTTVTAPTAGWTTFLANISAFYNENSFGQFLYHFTLASTITISPPSDPTRVSDTERDVVSAAATTAGFPLASYDVSYFSWPASVIYIDGQPNGGEARYYGGKPSGDITIGSTSAGRQFEVVAHELGHIAGAFVVLDYFGSGTGHFLPHSHAIVSDVQFVPNSPIQFNPARMIVADMIEYGNEYCTMGFGIGHFSARQKDALGWMFGRTQTVAASGSYTISNLEAASPVHPQALVVTSGGYTYWLEYRQPTGFDSFLGTSITTPITATFPTPTGPLVSVLANGTLFDPTPPFGQFDNMAFLLNMDPLLSENPYQPLQQGRTFTAPDGMTITTTAHTSTTTTVTVAGVTGHYPGDPSFGVWDDQATPGFSPPPYDPLCYLNLAEDGYLTRTATLAAKLKKTKLPTAFTGITSVRTALSTGVLVDGRRFDTSLGLYQVDNQDPTSNFIAQTKSTSSLFGRAAKSAVAAGAARKMYFAVDHNWKYQLAGTTSIGVMCIYYDKGFNGSTDKLSLVYDGQGGATTTHATTVTLGNTGTWKEAIWTITDAYFGGRMLTIAGSSFGDFYLTHPDSADLWISEVATTTAPSTLTTYYYLVGPNNASNVQGQLTSKILNINTGTPAQGVSNVSADDVHAP